MSRALSASDMAVHYGMTPRYWTRMAAEGKVPGGAHQEQGLHQRFAADRVTGEWFRPSEELLSVIAELSRSVPAQGGRDG